MSLVQVSGTRYLSIFPLIHSCPETPQQSDLRGKGLLDGGTPFYDIHWCKGGGWMSVGCLEPQFYQTFLEIFFKALPTDFQVHNGWKPSPERQYILEEWQKFLLTVRVHPFSPVEKWPSRRVLIMVILVIYVDQGNMNMDMLMQFQADQI
ncbi:hypothetical protein C8J56DRAFT_888514 [Mycena floridula]|nr:hypothetical protein C8J56DRAFT_888514 [Mycena floridula]